MLYLTYEELKHSDSRISLLWCFVPSRCILPMRNWNPLLDHHVAHCVHVLPYLWGIETFFLFFIVTSMNFVVPYLWGIETVLWCSFNLFRLLLCCTLPMRNWNPLATFSNNSFNILLYLTYEELKLLDSASSTMFSVTCCTLPMRNWNTIIFFIINFFSRYIFIFCCTLPMRNWNFFIVNSLL